MRSPAPGPAPGPDPDPDPLRSVAGLCRRRSLLILSGRMASGGGLGEPTEISDTAGLLQLRVAIIETGLGVRCGILTLIEIQRVNFRFTQTFDKNASAKTRQVQRLRL